MFPKIIDFKLSLFVKEGVPAGEGVRHSPLSSFNIPLYEANIL